MPDGVTFAREAVVTPSGDMRRPLVALAWLDPITQPPSGNIAMRLPTKTMAMADRELTLPALGRSLSEFARRSGLAGFWPWWTAQLNALVPSGHAPRLSAGACARCSCSTATRRRCGSPAWKASVPCCCTRRRFRSTGDAATVAAAGRAAVASLQRGTVA